MTTYTEQVTHATRGLAKVAVLGTGRLTATELDIAVLARQTLLHLAEVVVLDVAGIGRAGSYLPSAADVEAHPVSALARALRGHPRLSTNLAPTDAFMQPAPSSVGRAWQDAARSALTAHHLWGTGTVTTPDGAAAWAAVADMAAIAAVVVELDHELADAAKALPGRQLDGARLALSATSGLRTVAREVATVAHSGPLPLRGPEPTPAANRQLVHIRTPQDAVAAQHQLASLLLTAEHVRPERLTLLTLGHLRTCQGLAQVWRALPGTPADLQAALGEHIDRLTTATGQRAIAASIDGGDPRPLHQAAILRQAMQPDRVVLRALAADPELSGRYVQALAETTRALADTADRHLTRGTWLLPSRDDDDALRWVPAHHWHDIPAPYQALRAAAVHADHLTATAATATAASGPDRHGPARTAAAPGQPLAVRQVLAPAPFRPLGPERGIRPQHPGIPTRPMAPVVDRPSRARPR